MTNVANEPWWQVDPDSIDDEIAGDLLRSLDNAAAGMTSSKVITSGARFAKEARESLFGRRTSMTLGFEAEADILKSQVAIERRACTAIADFMRAPVEQPR